MLKHLSNVFILLALVPGIVQAQTPELVGGFSSLGLKGNGGEAQRLDGPFVTGRLLGTGPWSLEGDARSLSGTDADSVHFRRWSLQVGPRYSYALNPGLELYAHVLGGYARLEATRSSSQDQKGSAALTPGLGLDWKPWRQSVVRLQLDETLKPFGSGHQYGGSVSLGAGWRWGQGKGAPIAAPVPVAAARIEAPAPPPAERPQVAEVPVASAPPKPEWKDLILEFGPGSSELSTADRQKLIELAAAWKPWAGELRLSITGHASRIGRRNQALSGRRARTVTQVLQEAGLPESAFKVDALSFHQPRQPDTTVEGRARNRRVEIRRFR